MPHATDAIAARCAARGLDLHAATSVGAYNAEVPAEVHLPGEPDRMVLVIGNTKALWPLLDRFVREAAHMDDPVDRYVERVVGDAVAGMRDVVDVRFSHDAAPRLVAIQRLADVAGLAWLSPSHLCVHPTFGPWIALRAAIVLDRPFASPGTRLGSLCECSGRCMPALEAALAAGEANSAGVTEHWRRWLAVRDACPVGREHRYPDEQIEYHYTGARPSRWP
jgi:methylmalonic aciduria homocystinuria type C protein